MNILRTSNFPFKKRKKMIVGSTDEKDAFSNMMCKSLLFPQSTLVPYKTFTPGKLLFN